MRSHATEPESFVVVGAVMKLAGGTQQHALFM